MAEAQFRGRIDPNPPIRAWTTGKEDAIRKAKLRRLFQKVRQDDRN